MTDFSQVRLFGSARPAFFSLRVVHTWLSAKLMSPLRFACRYYVLGLPGWANASISCIATSLFFQAYMTFVQYSKRGWKERYTRTLLAGAGLGPMLEGYLVWTGGNVEKKDLWMPSTVIFMSMKAFEICFESIPESVIQMCEREALPLLLLHPLTLSSRAGPCSSPRPSAPSSPFSGSQSSPPSSPAHSSKPKPTSPSSGGRR